MNQFVKFSTVVAFLVVHTPALAQESGSTARQLAEEYSKLQKSCAIAENQLDHTKLQLSDARLAADNIRNAFSKCQIGQRICTNSLVSCRGQSKPVLELKQTIDRLKNQVERYLGTIAKLNSDMDRQTERIGNQQSQLSSCLDKSAATNQCNADLTDATGKIQQLRNEISRLTQDIDNAKKFQTQQQQIIDRTKSEVAFVQDKLDKANTEIARLNSSNGDRSELENRLKQEISTLKSDNANQNTQLNSCLSRSANLGDLPNKLQSCENNLKNQANLNAPQGPCGPVNFTFENNRIAIKGVFRKVAEKDQYIARLKQVYPDNSGIDDSDAIVSLTCARQIADGKYSIQTNDNGLIRVQKRTISLENIAKLPRSNNCAAIGREVQAEVDVIAARYRDFFQRFWVINGELKVFACTRTNTGGWDNASIASSETDSSALILNGSN